MVVTAVLCVYASTSAATTPIIRGREKTHAHRHIYIGLDTMAKTPVDARKKYKKIDTVYDSPDSVILN